jgi:hypothetical protein
MPEENNLLILVKNIIGEEYSDARVLRVITIAALMVSNEVLTLYDYEIDLSHNTITPDPFDVGDIGYVNLIVLKAACMILQSEAKVAANSTITVTDGPSTITTGGRYKSFKDFADSICAEYHVEKSKYQLNRGGRAVLTPTATQGLRNRGY